MLFQGPKGVWDRRRRGQSPQGPDPMAFEAVQEYGLNPRTTGRPCKVQKQGTTSDKGPSGPLERMDSRKKRVSAGVSETRWKFLLPHCAPHFLGQRVLRVTSPLFSPRLPLSNPHLPVTPKTSCPVPPHPHTAGPWVPQCFSECGRIAVKSTQWVAMAFFKICFY